MPNEARVDVSEFASAPLPHFHQTTVAPLPSPRHCSTRSRLFRGPNELTDFRPGITLQPSNVVK